MLVTIRASIPEDSEHIMDIWRRSVDTTHDFLSPEDRRAIETEVSVFLPNMPLWVAVNRQNQAVAFMLLDGNHMEALFVDPAYRGSGVGRSLIKHALHLSMNLTTDVNEQNSQAVGFYEHMGFQRTGYSATDAQGRPYPLIHLRYAGEL